MVVGGQFGIGVKIYDWDRRDSNPEPRDYESPALTVELRSRIFPARAPGLLNSIAFGFNCRKPKLDRFLVSLERLPPANWFPGLKFRKIMKILDAQCEVKGWRSQSCRCKYAFPV